MPGMETGPKTRQRYVAAIAAFACVTPTTLALGAGDGGGGGGSGCKNAGEPVRQLSTTAARNAFLCLLNDERRRHARSPLKPSKALQQVAQKHTKKMVQSDCLAHRCPGEKDLETRIKDSGYTDGAARFGFAQNTGCGLTAKAMVANWMASRFHRINILDKEFQDLGVGFTAARVESRCKRGYGTFATVFGFRKT